MVMFITTTDSAIPIQLSIPALLSQGLGGGRDRGSAEGERDRGNLHLLGSVRVPSQKRSSGGSMRIPFIAGAMAFLAQAGAAGAGVSESKITELLLAALVAMAIYIARETHRHGICLFGAKGNPNDNGLSGKIDKLETWRMEATGEMHDVHDEVDEILDEIREAHGTTRPPRFVTRNRKRRRALPK